MCLPLSWTAMLLQGTPPSLSYHIPPVLIRSIQGSHQLPIHGTSMKPVSTLHPPSRLSWPVRVESGLLPSLLVKCVCSQDTEEAQDVIIHDQTSSQGRPSLPPSVPMKLPFYTHLPLRLFMPLRLESGLLPSLLTI